MPPSRLGHGNVFGDRPLPETVTGASCAGRAGVLEVHHLVALRDGGAALDLDNLVVVVHELPH